MKRLQNLFFVNLVGRKASRGTFFWFWGGSSFAPPKEDVKNDGIFSMVKIRIFYAFYAIKIKEKFICKDIFLRLRYLQHGFYDFKIAYFFHAFGNLQL